MKRALNNTDLTEIRRPNDADVCDECLLRRFPLSACMLAYCPVNKIFVNSNYLSDIFTL